MPQYNKNPSVLLDRAGGLTTNPFEKGNGKKNSPPSAPLPFGLVKDRSKQLLSLSSVRPRTPFVREDILAAAEKTTGPGKRW